MGRQNLCCEDKKEKYKDGIMNDYKERKYLSAVEVAQYLGITVRQVHNLLKSGKLKGFRSASGQYRFDLRDVKETENYIRGSKFKVFAEPEARNIN